MSKYLKDEKACPAGFRAVVGISAMLGLGLLLGSGCGKPRVIGVVQSSKLAQNGYELALDTSNSCDYVVVQLRALLDAQGKIAPEAQQLITPTRPDSPSSPALPS